jgi:hypothetical protein
MFEFQERENRRNTKNGYSLMYDKNKSFHFQESSITRNGYIPF